jgi:hypothetical protein
MDVMALQEFKLGVIDNKLSAQLWGGLLEFKNSFRK